MQLVYQLKYWQQRQKIKPLNLDGFEPTPANQPGFYFSLTAVVAAGIIFIPTLRSISAMNMFLKTCWAIAIPLCLYAQQSDEELISWSSTKRLAWSDYKASPDPNSDAAASTTTYLMISYKISDTHFSYAIESKFSRTRSWGLHKTAYILSHEQGHFDIAEVFARKLNKKMKEYVFNRRTYQKELKKIYQDILNEKEEIQNRYDKETNHSINKEKQAEWLKKIVKMLDEYKAYADY